MRGRKVRWVLWPLVGALVGVASFVLVVNMLSRPVVHASSFWPESVSGLAREADLVVLGRLGEQVASYRGGVSGTIGGDPSDDGIAGVVYEFHVDEILGGVSHGTTIYVTYLDTLAYPGYEEFPTEAVVFLQHTVVDQADLDELSEFVENLYTPLGTQGLFRVRDNSAESLSPKMESLTGQEKGVPMLLSDLASAVRSAFSAKEPQP